MFFFCVITQEKNKLIGVTPTLLLFTIKLFRLNDWSRIIFTEVCRVFQFIFFLNLVNKKPPKACKSFSKKVYCKKNFINGLNLDHCIIDRIRCKIWWMEKFLVCIFFACNLLSEWNFMWMNVGHPYRKFKSTMKFLWFKRKRVSIFMKI